MLWIPVMTCLAFKCFGAQMIGPPYRDPEECVRALLTVQRRAGWDPAWLDCNPHGFKDERDEDGRR